jgi:hypothetical protein
MGVVGRGWARIGLGLRQGTLAEELRRAKDAEGKRLGLEDRYQSGVCGSRGARPTEGYTDPPGRS